MHASLRLAAITALAVLTLSCSSSSQTTAISDPTAATVLKLVAVDAEKPVVSLDIRGTGSIKGKAEILLMLDGKPYRIEQLQGDVSFRWGGDWYSPTAEIHYRPLKVEGGQIRLQYHFGRI